MNRALMTSFFIVLMLLVACQTNSAKSDLPDFPSNAFLDGGRSKVGVILCHGRAKYPTWLVVDPLRKGIHQQLGYHTLSIQMPARDVDWRDYANYFPEAERRIAAAIKYLRDEKGVSEIYLMGHSMGSRMASSFLANHPDAGITGFIAVGIRNNGGSPLDGNTNLMSVKIPVLDVYGDGGNGKDAAHAAERFDMVSERYQQALIEGADHKFENHEKELVTAVVKWLNGHEQQLSTTLVRDGNDCINHKSC
jgi:predicted alpha/beta-hydrolase family hydrolase